MHRRMLKVTTALLWLSFLIGFGSAHSGQPPLTLWLELGQIHIESLQERPTRVAIAAPDVVDVQFNEANEFVFLPMAVGETDVAWWFVDGSRVQRRVQVLPTGSKRLLDVLRVNMEGGKALQGQWQQQRFMLEGRVAGEQFARLEELQGRYPYLDLSLLQVDESKAEMLELEVYVVELSRRFIRTTGLSWENTMQGPTLAVLGDIFGNSELRPQQESLSSQSGQRGLYLGWAGNLHSTLQLLQERGEGKVLAKPRIRVESGMAADFLVGGELPIPQVNAQGLTDVTFKPYGIRLQVAPTLLSSGWIRTELSSEVSQPDSSVAVQGIPGLRSRKATTQVTSKHNETAVIAGLISQDEFTGASGLPSLRGTDQSLPFAQDRTIQYLDTELVVFVTARRLAIYEQEQAELRDAWLKLQQRFNQIGCQGMAPSSHQGESL